MAKKKVEETQHALLSASGAERWINCTPSARLEEQYGVDTGSVYASEGTLAHELGEVSLRFLSNQIEAVEYQERLNDIEVNPLYSTEMPEEVEKYTDFVMEQWLDARKDTPDAVLIIEKQVDFSDVAPNGFGTLDASIVANKVLKICDLKYGKGVRVSAVDNAQLKLYAYGAYRAFEMLYDIHTVVLNICQPRMDNFSTWEISVEDLLKWIEEVVKPAALLADKGKGKLKAGDHCKFCKMRRRCKELAKTNLDIAKYEFKSPELLTDAEVSDILKRASLFTNWINGITEFALEQALDGKKYPGFKLVAGRSVRTWLDKDKVVSALVEAGFKETDILDTKLKGITAIEKVVGKKSFEPLLGPLVVKPEGKPTLVEESDKRLEINSAVTDFQ